MGGQLKMTKPLDFNTFQDFLESEGLLPLSQEPSTACYPEPDQYTQH
jgi:hypothetical protein